MTSLNQLAGLSAGATQLYSAVRGSPLLVQFLNTAGQVLVQFDTTPTETYGHDATVTESPVERGGSVNDHIILKPFSLDLTGVVSDSPLAGRQALITEGVSVASSAILPPLGLIAGTTALATWRAQQQSTSPSRAAYAQLVRLYQGDPTTTPPTRPEPFQVKSALGTFDNMVLASLSAPRDAKTGAALIFQCKLTQLNIVAAQTVNVTVLDKPGLAANKQAAGEKQAEDNKYADIFTKGRVAGLDAEGERIGGS